MRCTYCACEKHPTGFLGSEMLLLPRCLALLPDSSPLRPAQTCSDLSVPLVALLDRALASTLRGGAVEMLSHYGVLATGPGLATRMEFEQDNRNVLVQYWPGLPHVVG